VDLDWGNVTLQSAVLREAAPIVSLQVPANGSIFNRASAGLLFTASTIAPFSIAPARLDAISMALTCPRAWLSVEPNGTLGPLHQPRAQPILPGADLGGG